MRQLEVVEDGEGRRANLHGAAALRGRLRASDSRVDGYPARVLVPYLDADLGDGRGWLASGDELRASFASQMNTPA